jgi:WD40 repeat protein
LAALRTKHNNSCATAEVCNSKADASGFHEHDVASYDGSMFDRHLASRAAIFIWVLTFAPNYSFAAPFVPTRDAHCVAFSPDGKTVAIGISGQSNSEFPPRPHPSPRKSAVVQLFDLATRKRLRRLETFGDLTQIAFSADGAMIAAARLYATDDGIEMNEVRVWDVADGQTRRAFDRCHAFCFLPGRSEIVVASRKRCVVFDLVTNARVRQIPALANAISIAPAPRFEHLCAIVQTGEGFAIRVCNSQSGTAIRESQPLPDPFYHLAFSANGRDLATGHAGGTILLWDVSSLEPARQLVTGTPGRAFPFFSANGELLGAADQTNSDVVFWDMKSSELLTRFTFQQGSVHTFRSKSAERTVRPEEDPARFAFSADGASFLGGPFGGILRAVNDGRELARFGD